MQAEGPWLEFHIGESLYALPAAAVAQVVGLEELRPSNVPGWVGLLSLRDGTLPLADGARILGGTGSVVRGRGVVLRNQQPIGFTTDWVVGLTSGSSSPLDDYAQQGELAAARLERPERCTIVLDADRVWHRLQDGLALASDGRHYRLTPLAASDREETPTVATDRAGFSGPGAPAPLDQPISSVPAATETQPTLSGAVARQEQAAAGRTAPAAAAPFPGGKVLVFRAGLPIDLAVPLEQVLGVGPAGVVRPLPSGPKHLAGLLEWRGRLVPLVDLVRRLGSVLAGPPQTLYLAIPGRAARALAVSVAEVAGPALVPAVGPTPAEFGIPGAWSRGAARLGARPLVVLDPAALAAS